VPISGQNARRTLFATVDLRNGRRVVMVSRRQRLSDYHRFLRRLRTGAGAKGALWLLLDRHNSHKSPSSLRLAAALNITLVWLPRQCPRLNPVDHLWRGLKNDLAANRQFASIDEQARYAETWVRTLSPLQTLRKAGLLSKHCWLRKVRKILWPPCATSSGRRDVPRPLRNCTTDEGRKGPSGPADRSGSQIAFGGGGQKPRS
jgi:transposase